MRKYLFIFLTAFFSACSHVDQAKYAERAATKADQNLTLAQSAHLMRISDYGQEAKYGIALMPLNPEQKAVDEVLDLLIKSAGPGKLSEADREKFMNSIIKNDPNTIRVLAQAAKTDADQVKTIADDRQQKEVADIKITTLLNAGAAAQDKIDELWDCVYALIALGFLAMVLYIIGKFGAAAATVAAKVP